jgi:hypothetical protein
MATLTGASAKKVKDPALVLWLLEDRGEDREILVDVVLPHREVRFSPNADGCLRPRDIREGSDYADRKEVLKKLGRVLARLLDTPPVVLETAGALIVRANSEQVRQFVSHPLVKAVRPNRRLRPPPGA